MHQRHLFTVGLRGLLFSMLALWIWTDVQAQAWPQAKGHAYVKLSHGRTSTAEQYRFDGATKPYADNVAGDAFFDRSFYLYAEYGLTDNLTLVATVPYKRLRVLDAAFSYESEGLGSVSLGLRAGLKPRLGITSDRHALAANVQITVPTGYTRNFAPALGSGQVDVQGTFSHGISFYPLPLYSQVTLGYRYRSSFYGLSGAIDCQEGRDIDCFIDTEPGYTDEAVFAGEFGVSAGRWALVQVLVQGVWSVHAPTPATTFSARNPIPTRQRYLKAGGGLTLYPMATLGLSVQAFFTPYGRNTIRSTDVFWGIEYRL